MADAGIEPKDFWSDFAALQAHSSGPKPEWAERCPAHPELG
jgi:hypothetical protein